MSTAYTATSSAFGALETADTLTSQQIEQKAQQLLEQLTLEEKLNMLDGDAPFWKGMGDMFNGGYSQHAWVAGAVPRLGIPGVRFSDGPRGVVMPGATTFPVSMARGASWDADLEERIGDVIGREMRAMGANHFGGVCINLLRHPAWGRAQETFGEDPYLLGVFGAAMTRGVQRHVMACAKHYALNSMENARFKVNATVDERALREIYLPHFKRAVDAGVASVMSAYNSVNGEWCGQNQTLLNDILKQEWGFQGYVMTDFIFGMRDAKKAILAGQNVEMPFQLLFNRDLASLLEAGEVPMAVIDDAALRILRQQVRFAQGRNPADYGAEVVGCAAHRQLAREAAQKGIVLLKNEGGLLPLKNVQRIAVIGQLADKPNTGDSGSSNTNPAYVVTPLQGLRSALGDSVEIVYDDGSDLARAALVAQGAETIICVVGYTSADEGEYIAPDTMGQFASSFPQPTPEEQPILQAMMAGAPQPENDSAFGVGGDRSSLALHTEDEALIQAVAAANPQTIIAIMAGSAVITEAWREQVPAILMLWYPGMEGGNAFADVLLGKVNPSGRLPCVFARRVEDLPFFDKDAEEITYDLWHGYRKLERDECAPAFPFGFGLSYTTYAYQDLRLAKAELTPADNLQVMFSVTNTGAVAGETVVQLYVTALHSKVERAPKELKAFTRVAVEPGETQSVQLEVPVKDLAYYDLKSGWVVEPTEYDVIVGQHSLDEHALRARFCVA